MNRRGFLGVFGGALLGSRKAVAEAAKGEAERLVMGPPNVLSSGMLGSMWPSAPMDPEQEKATALRDLANLFRPDNIEKLRRQIVVRSLDPDIASMRSFSLAVKFSMQRERELERRLEVEKTALERFISRAVASMGGPQ